MILRGLFCAFLLCLWVGTSLQAWFFDPYTKIRWCRSKVRSCSRQGFNKFIADKIEAAQNASASMNSTVGSSNPKPPDNTTAPAGQRRRRRSEDLFSEFLDLSQEDTFRLKREDGSNGTEPGNSNLAPPPKNETAGPPPTTSLPDYPESISLAPPPLFINTDLEESFYGCLDQLDIHRCYEYMWQRCNWHDGTSKTIRDYCSKWKIKCGPCGK